MIWPSAADERAATLKKLGVPADTNGWKRYRLHVQVAFFVLTLVGIGAFSGAALLNRSIGSTANAIVVILTAEYLIRKYRFFATGVETALWIAGVVFIILALPSSGKPEGILVIGSLVAIAGARLLNPFLGGLAAISIIIYAAAKNATPLQCTLLAVVMALGAAAAQLAEWQRRTVERLFQTIAILAPLTGLAAAEFGSGTNRQAIAIVYIIAAAIILALGIAVRARALLLTGALHTAIAAYEASHLNNLPFEAKLIAGGVVMLAIAIVTSRILRKNTTGFVTSESSLTGYDEVMQIAGAIHVSPNAPAHSAPGNEFQGGGGNFGGGGASAGY